MSGAENVVIIGAGVAGLTAALYAARANLAPVCLEGPEAGGQLMITTDVENYPGFPEAVTGPQLIELMRRQAERFGARFLRERAASVDLSRRPFLIRAEERDLSARALIVATGARARWLGLESEEKLRGHGVSACATCDGFFFKGKEVLVAGGGDSALEEALFLTKFCSKVTIVHRRDELRGSKIMASRARGNEKIAFTWDSAIEEIHDPAQLRVTGATLLNLKTKERRRVDCEGVFVAIGHAPDTAFLAGQVSTDANGFLVRENGTSATSAPGVFAAGDVADPRYKQAVTAAGSGCMAAIDAERFLQESP